ncbi:MAG: hypothetical protein JWO38_8335, partial [Gemmataceae bacterium]|nr:hypothetical protein [Gemmataceae bacterium]MDB5314133.1 hypothetical protein [Gemmataceae bacterium]
LLPTGGPVVVAGMCGAAAALTRCWVRASTRAVGLVPG